MAQPFANASFPLTGHDIGTLSRFRLRTAEYQHEMAVLTVTNSASVYPDMITGSPVVVEWGTPDRSDVFVGYVAFVRPAVSPTVTAPGAMPQGLSMEVYCLGATFPMKEQRQNVFLGNTAEKIVQAVAGAYQLNVFAEPHPRVWPTYTQAGVSDWTFLASLAHDVGYTLYAKNTQIRFHSRLLEVNRGAEDALMYDFTNTGSNTVLPNQRQIMEFAPVISDLRGLDGTTRARRVVFDYDRRNNKILVSQDNTGPVRVLGALGTDPIFTEFITGLSSDSLGETLQWLTDIGEDRRWYVTAEAQVQGDTRLTPAHLVYFRNLPSDFSGYWYIRSVEHDITMFPKTAAGGLPAQYTACLSLGRDGFGESTGEPNALPQRAITALADIGVPEEVATTSQLTSAGYWKASAATTSVSAN